MKKATILLALLFVYFPAFAQKALPKELNAFRKNLQEGLLWQATIEFKTFDSFTKEEESHSGQLILGLDSYKMELELQVFLVKDSTSQVWEKPQNRILVSHYKPQEDDTSPARFLYAVDSVYQWQREQLGGNKTRISLHTEDPFEMYRQVELLFTDGSPTRIKAYDQADNRIEIYFSRVNFLKFSKSLLDLNPPKDIEILDLRQ